MRALTLRQPWAWLITQGLKRTEYRSWVHSAEADEWIALHAGSGVDRTALADAQRDDGAPELGELPRSAIVALARFGAPVPDKGISTEPPYGEVQTGWAWPIIEVRVLKRPVPCGGKLNLWRVSPEVEARIERTQPMPRQTKRVAKSSQIGLRLEPALMNRVETLAQRLARPGLDIDRTTVLRMCIAEGLPVVERSAGIAPASRRK